MATKREIPTEPLDETAARKGISKAEAKRRGVSLKNALAAAPSNAQSRRNKRRAEINRLIADAEDNEALQKSFQDVRRRHQQEDALAGYVASGTIAGACRAAGVTRPTIVGWVENDEVFARLWADAVESFADDLEEVAIVRAKTTSDPLMAMMLKAHKPNKYKDKRELTGANGSELIPLSLIRQALADPKP